VDENTRRLLTVLDVDARRLHLLLVRLTLRADVAEDLMQELFLKLHDSRGFRQADNPCAYARRAAIHLAFDWRRRQRRRADTAPLGVDPKADGASPLDRLVAREQLAQTLAALDRLPKLARECLVLRYLENEPYETIAEQVGKTPHQARALCHKAIVRLRKLLNVDADSDSSKETFHGSRS
jgi:RNA polymerase sigma-70 factor (ECF subfamily)